MIEIDVVTALVILVVLGVGVNMLVGRKAHQRAIRVPPGVQIDDDVEMTRVSVYYRLAKRMAHELNALASQDDQLPFMQPERRHTIETLLNEWELM